MEIHQKLLQQAVQTQITCQCDVLTDLFFMVLGFEADNLQDAGAGDFGHHVGHALPHTQQSAAQHVVLTEAHALQTLVALLDFLAFTVPRETGRKRGRLTDSSVKLAKYPHCFYLLWIGKQAQAAATFFLHTVHWEAHGNHFSTIPANLWNSI